MQNHTASNSVTYSPQILLNELAVYNAPAGTNPRYACAVDSVPTIAPRVAHSRSLKTVVATAERLQDLCEQLHASLVRLSQ